jgi:hypothetical protein
VPADDKEALLEDLRRRKNNRTLAEAEEALSAWGFTRREASKESAVWQREGVTLTLPTPHGGDKVLLTPYVSLVVRKIKEVKAIVEGFDHGE